MKTFIAWFTLKTTELSLFKVLKRQQYSHRDEDDFCKGPFSLSDSRFALFFRTFFIGAEKFYRASIMFQSEFLIKLVNSEMAAPKMQRNDFLQNNQWLVLTEFRIAKRFLINFDSLYSTGFALENVIHKICLLSDMDISFSTLDMCQTWPTKNNRLKKKWGSANMKFLLH